MALRPVPTGIDLINAAIYGENSKRGLYFEQIISNSNMPEYNNEKVWKEEVTDWGDELGSFVDYSKLYKKKDYVWRKDIDIDICSELSCFPFTYSGDTCTPTTETHRGITVNDQVMTFCSKSCYYIDYDPQNPYPTMPFLAKDVQGKCRVMNPSQTLWIQLPNTRDTKDNSGITNVPMFKEIPLTEAKWSEVAYMTNTYCKWFGLDHKSEGVGNCKRNIWTTIVAQFTGDSIARFCTQLGISSVRKSAYMTFLPDYIDTIPIGNVLGSHEGQKAFNRIRKKALNMNISEELKERIRRGRVSQFLVKTSQIGKMDVTSKEGFAAFQKSIHTSKAEDDEGDDEGDEWLVNGLGGDWWIDIIREVIGIGVIIGESIAIDLVIDATFKIIKKLSGKASKFIMEKITLMASKLLVKKVMQTVFMKMVTNVTINVAKAIAAAIARIATTVCTVIGIMLNIIGFAGLILDLLDVGSFNGYLDKEYVRNIMSFFWDSFVDVFYASMGTTEEVETPYNILPEYTPSVFYHSVIYARSVEDDIDENSSGDKIGVMKAEDPTNYDRGEDELMFATEIEEISKYLLALKYNSAGQEIDWNLTEKPTISQKGYLSVTECLKAQRRINSAVLDSYNANIRALYTSEISSPYLFYPILCTSLAGGICIWITLQFFKKEAINEFLFVFLLLMLIIMLSLVYVTRNLWLRKTNLLQTNIDTVVKNVFQLSADKNTSIATTLLRAANEAHRLIS